MKQQLSTLRDLISVLDPQMYAHLGSFSLSLSSHPVPFARQTTDQDLAGLFRLFDHIMAISSEKTESLNLFFCFRCVFLLLRLIRSSG